MVVVNHWMMVHTSLVVDKWGMPCLIVVDKWEMPCLIMVDQWVRSSLVVNWWTVHGQCVEGGLDGCLGFGV